MPTVQMPDGTLVEMPDQLTPELGKRLRALQQSQAVKPQSLADQIPGNIPQPIPQPSKPWSLRGMADTILEPAATIATGAVAMPFSNIAGAIASPVAKAFGADIGSGENVARKISNFLTYQPRSEEGRNALENVGWALRESKLEGLPVVGAELPMLGRAIAQQRPYMAAAAAQAPGAMARAALPKLSPEAVALAEKAQQYGIPLRPDMLTDNNIIKMMGGLLEKVPLSGAKNVDRQVAFNRALINEIGGDTSATRLTPDVFNDAITMSGKTIGRIAERNKVIVDDPVLTSFANIADDVKKFGTDESARIVANYIDELLGKSQNGAIPGEAFKAINSKLGRQITTSQDKYPLMQLQDAMHEALTRSVTPEEMIALKEARRLYSNAKTIEPLVAKAFEGDISPAGLMGAVTSNKQMKASMAKGNRGELGDIARVGQLLKEPGSSGTTERGIAALMLGGGGAVNLPAAAGVYGMANVYNRAGPAMTNYLVSKNAARNRLAP